MKIDEGVNGKIHAKVRQILNFKANYNKYFIDKCKLQMNSVKMVNVVNSKKSGSGYSKSRKIQFTQSISELDS